jgi:hypothetical protein
MGPKDANYNTSFSNVVTSAFNTPHPPIHTYTLVVHVTHICLTLSHTKGVIDQPVPAATDRASSRSCSTRQE